MKYKTKIKFVDFGRCLVCLNNPCCCKKRTSKCETDGCDQLAVVKLEQDGKSYCEKHAKIEVQVFWQENYD